MKTRLKNMLTTNIGLKILAVILAVFMWLVVVNVDDPTQTKSFTTTVEVLNENVLLEQGKYYKIVGDNTVTFRVTAKRSVIEKLSGTDFSAVADMNYLENNSRIPIDITLEKMASSVSISGKTHYLEVVVGEEMSNQFNVQAVSSGTPAQGCAVEQLIVVPNLITINGPQEIVSQIHSVRATINVDGANDDVKESVVPEILDESGNKIDTSELKISEATVDVVAKIATVISVPIKVETSGELQDHLQIASIRVNPENIQVKGEAEVLNKLSEITIPGSVINLSKITENFKTEIDITGYLPEGVTLLQGASSKVEIEVNLEKQITKIFKIPTANLTVTNLSEGMEADFLDETVEVEIMALSGQLSQLNEATITGTVDVSGLSQGEVHSVNVQITLDDIYRTKVTTTKIKIVRREN